MSPPAGEVLERARRRAGLSLVQLWWSYVTLGGSGSPVEVEAYLGGALRPDAAQYNRLAQALNDHFTALGEDHPVPYADGPG